MLTRISWPLVALLLLWIAPASGKPGFAQASGISDAVSESQSTSEAKGPSHLTVPKDQPNLNQSLSQSLHFEPLILLLLGSTLFSIGTTIKLIISKKLKGNAMANAAKRSAAVRAPSLQRFPGR